MLGKWGTIKVTIGGLIGVLGILFLILALSGSTLNVKNSISFDIADEIGAEVEFSGTNSSEEITNMPEKLLIKPTETQQSRSIVIPNQKFKSINSEIVYVFRVKNTSEKKSFTATASIANISPDLESKISASVSYSKVGSDSFENANTLSVGETTEIKITFVLLDDTSSFDYEPNITIEIK